MVHKKYIKRNGKVFGPYLYDNKRVNGKVVSKYLGVAEEEKKGFSFDMQKIVKFSIYFVIGFIFLDLVLLGYLLINGEGGRFGIFGGGGSGVGGEDLKASGIDDGVLLAPLGTIFWTYDGVSSCDGTFDDPNCWDLPRIPGLDDVVEINSGGLGDMIVETDRMPQDLGYFVVTNGYTGEITFEPNFACDATCDGVGGTQDWTVANDIEIEGGTMFIYGDTSGGPINPMSSTPEGKGQIWKSLNGHIAIGSGALIDGVGLGFSMMDGPGYGGIQTPGTHAGRGYDASTNIYGNPLGPTSLGSGGESISGGSAIKLEAFDYVEINGTIDMSAPSGIWTYSGAGGSIWIESPEILGDGALLSDGGDSSSGEGGGGGWIRLGYDVDILPDESYKNTMKFSGIISLDRGFGSLNTQGRPRVGESGRLTFTDSIWPGNWTLTGNIGLGGGDYGERTAYAEKNIFNVIGNFSTGGYNLSIYGDCYLDSTNPVSCYGGSSGEGRGVWINASGNISISYGDILKGTGFGFMTGPGYEMYRGGTYGGSGGGNDVSVLDPYGDPRMPISLGSGGDEVKYSLAGGSAIKLQSVDRVIVNGSIQMTGGSSSNGYGGSGGSIWISARNISGNGVLNVSGGTSSASGGGGGRISLESSYVVEFNGDIFSDGGIDNYPVNFGHGSGGSIWINATTYVADNGGVNVSAVGLSGGFINYTSDLLNLGGRYYASVYDISAPGFNFGMITLDYADCIGSSITGVFDPSHIVYGSGGCYPIIKFEDPTPSNNFFLDSNILNVNTSINVSSYPLKNASFGFNGIGYAKDDLSLVLMMDMDNSALLGETDDKFVDISSYGNDGSCVAGVSCPSEVSGKRRKAMKFNGFTDYIEILDDPSLHTSSFSVSAWVNRDDVIGSETKVIAAKTQGNGAGDMSWNLKGDVFNLYAGTTAYGLSYSDTGNVIPAGEWHHVVGIYDEASLKMELYLDGVKVGERILAESKNIRSFPVHIGARNNGATLIEYFEGSIDEVRIWNRSLSFDDVQMVYRSNLFRFSEIMDDPTLALMLNLDKSSLLGETDSLFVDVSGEGNDGSCVVGVSCPTRVANGKFGGAYSFDGSSQFIDIPDQDPGALDTRPFVCSISHTISAWFKSPDLAANRHIYAEAHTGGDSRVDVYLDDNGYVKYHVKYTGSEPYDLYVDSSLSYDDNLWHQVVTVRNGNTYSLYVDGQFINSSSDGRAPFCASVALSIGKTMAGGAGNTPNYFNGEIDEVRTWRRALTSKQIKDQYLSGLQDYTRRDVEYNMYDDSLVLMLGLDNNFGIGECGIDTTCGNADDTFVDVSSYGNDGSCIWDAIPANNKCPVPVSGVYDGAYEFDGVDDVINLGNVIGLTGEISVGAWFYKKGNVGGFTGLAGKYGGAFEGYGLNYDDQNRMRFTVGDGAQLSQTIESYQTSLNEWIYYMGTFDGSVSRLYKNGELVDTGSSISGAVLSSDNFKIGSADFPIPLGGPRFVDGIIDEVRVWDRKLSKDEILEQYHSNLQKFNDALWFMDINQSVHYSDDQNYRSCASNSPLDNEVCTEGRVVDVITSPVVSFENPTPSDGFNGNFGSIEINFSILEDDLKEINYSWDVGIGGTPESYSLYDDSLILMMNLDNNGELGESDGIFVDVSRSGNVGDCEVGVNCPTSVIGRYGGGGRFNGVDDSINLGNPAELNKDFKKLSIEFWMYAESNTGTDAGLVGKGTTTGLTYNTGSPVYFYVGNDKGANSISTDPVPSQNNWHYIVGVFDGTALPSPIMRIYVDGVLNKEGVSAHSSTGINNVDFTIGKATNYFGGVIDEVRVWDRVLSDSEILKNYNSNLRKLEDDRWSLNVTQPILTIGAHSYSACASDIFDIEGCDSRSVIIGAIPLEILDIEDIPPQGIVPGGQNPVSFNVRVKSGRFLESPVISAEFDIDGVIKTASCGSPVVISPVEKEYPCTINIDYYDTAGFWNVNAYASISTGTPESVSYSEQFILMSEAHVSHPKGLTWAGLDLSSKDKPITLLVNNVGNVDFGPIKMEAHPLLLDGTGPQSIDLGVSPWRFRVGIIDEVSSCSSSIGLDGGVVDVVGSALPRGSGSQEALYICIKDIPGGLPLGNYIATGIDNAWRLTFVPGITAPDVVSGMIANWTFDEGFGIYARDTSSIAPSFDGILYNMDDFSWFAYGKYNTALDFDGINDYVDIGNVDLVEGLSAFSISAWVNKDDASVTRTIMAQQDELDYGTSADSFELYWDNTERISMKVYNNLGASATGTYLIGSTDNDWHHVVGVYDGANVKVYVDGSLGTSASLTGSVSGSLLNFVIGSRSGGVQPVFWKGLIDDVRVYNRALSDREVKVLYTG